MMLRNQHSEWMAERIRESAIPFAGVDDLDSIAASAGEAGIVLLGEASHGTSEFYTIRAELSKRLIERKGFNLIAVEGDWPSCYRVNRYIKGYGGAAASARDALGEFNRWPTWMWANREVEAFIDWLKAYNEKLPEGERVGFYGIDMYSLWESMEAIIGYLERTNSPQLELAKKAFACFEPFSRDEQSYGVSAGFLGEGCEDDVVRLLTEMKEKRKQDNGKDEASLDAELNALVAVNAEQYYRTMVRGGPDSWNVRDRHMVKALGKVMDFYGQKARAIVWEHNTHIGDARATDMAEEGMVNVGQLLRESEPAGRVYAVGFGTHSGTVLAGRAWGAPVQEMEVPPAMDGSWEDAMHKAGGGGDLILLFDEANRADFSVGEIGHRAIGVVYHPRHERGNYVPSVMGERYDAFVHVDRTQALHALEVELVHA